MKRFVHKRIDFEITNEVPIKECKHLLNYKKKRWGKSAENIEIKEAAFDSNELSH